MADIAQLGLKEPEQVDWDNYNPGSKYTAPPEPADPAGNLVTFQGQLPSTIVPEVSEKSGYRTFLLDPIKIVKSGAGADGYEIRFARVSVEKFKSADGTKVYNASSAGNLIKSAGSAAKPQKTFEYDSVLKQLQGKVVSFTLDWEAKNKETGEQIRGYRAFPVDAVTGIRQAVLHAGDSYNVLDAKRNLTGQTAIVKSEVLFANGRVNRFVDPNKK